MTKNANPREYKFSEVFVVNPYEELGNAIILQAVKDYRHTSRSTELESIERFFRSRLFGTITSVDPENLIKRLREEKQYVF